MVDILISVDETKLKEILHNMFDSLYDVNNAALYKKYLDRLVDDCSATFFFGHINLETWLKDTVNDLEVITPANEDYEYVYSRWEKQEYNISNSISIVEELNGYILIDHNHY